MDEIVLQIISTNPTIRNFYEKEFRQEGYENILLAKDCNETFKQMQNEGIPDVVLCFLPLYDGPHCSPAFIQKVCESGTNPVP